MNLSDRGRFAILCSSAAFFALPLALVIPVSLLAKSTNNLGWLILLFVLQICLAGVFDLTVYKVVRREFPDYPAKRQEYSPAQLEWVARNRRRVFSQWPYIILGVVMLCALLSQGRHLDNLIDQLLLMPVAPRIIMTTFLSVPGLAVDIALGEFVAEKRIHNVLEFMAARDSLG